MRSAPLFEVRRSAQSMKVEIWSDVICPWCYIGKRRFEKALSQFDGRNSAEVAFRSFELDPEASSGSDMTVEDVLAKKYRMGRGVAQKVNERTARVAAEEGLEFRLDLARPTNTLNAHRILQLASVRRIRPAVEERFQKGYFCEGALMSDPETLLRLATEAGLDGNDARRVLAGQAFTLQVRNDEKEATELGAKGVPFFVFDRQRQVSGAQPTELFLQALRAGEPLDTP